MSAELIDFENCPILLVGPDLDLAISLAEQLKFRTKNLNVGAIDPLKLRAETPESLAKYDLIIIACPLGKVLELAAVVGSKSPTSKIASYNHHDKGDQEALDRHGIATIEMVYSCREASLAAVVKTALDTVKAF